MRPLAISLYALVFFIASCSILKKDDPEVNVRQFLTSFQTNLQQSDEIILKQFEAKQNEYVILQVIKILQNKDNALIKVYPNFTDAAIAISEEEIKVDVPVILTFDQNKSEDGGQAMLTLWLKAKDKSFVVTKLGGETLYQEFTSLKNRNEWVIAENAAFEQRKLIYEQAQQFETEYDSVIWYTTYNNQTFYYVVTGAWENYFFRYDSKENLPANAKMGLIASSGEVIIPMEYDLVGTLGFDQPNLVEVTKNGKVGIFDIQHKKLVIDPAYDVVIPYFNENVLAVVRKGRDYGWISKDTVYTKGFPSARLQSWVSTFEFLRKPVILKHGNQALCEVPRKESAGNGIVMPPSYFVANGLFEKIESGLSTTEIPMNGWTEYKETKGTVFERLTENINAVVTTIRQRYLEGREEFYTSNKLVFVSSALDTLRVSDVDGESITMASIDSTLLEVKTPQSYWFDEFGVTSESNLISYTYFRIIDNTYIERLRSNRLFPQTEFVKLDSSYITGDFTVYNNETEKNESRSILTAKTLSNMRDEILASYGYIFPDPEVLEQFKSYSWYQPRFNDVSEFEIDMTEVDKHNIAFLERVLRRMKSDLAMN